MFNVNRNTKNKYYSLYSEIRGEILRGKIKAGEKLPSKRSLAESLGVSVVTVELAYEQLLAEGYIRAKERSGCFVEKVNTIRIEPRISADQSTETRENEYKIDLTKGSAPAALFPFSVWTKLIRSVLSDCGEHLLERVPCDGDKELKTAIADYLYRSRGIDAPPEHVIIGAGAEHLYGVIVQLLGRDKLFAVENPGYGKISHTYKLNGATCLPIAVTDTGIDCTAVENSAAYAVHVSPSHQFPTGAVTPVSVRARLINRVKSSGGYIIEDDYDSEFRLSGKPLQSTYGLCPEKVIYLNTFSKSLAPSMRMGYAILPDELYEKYKKLFSGNANLVPLFEQKTLAAMLNGGYFERHLSRLRNHYKIIRKKLIAKLDELGAETDDSGSGLHVIAKFPQFASDDELKQTAAKADIKIKCLSDYLTAPLDVPTGCAVINYSGITERQIENLKI